MGDEEYRLDDAVGFLLRRANQRHLSVFGAVIPEVTTTQLAALARLAELGPMSQNQLGRVTAMDAATIKGVVGRLVMRRLVATVPSEEDRRRLIVDLTPEGRALFDGLRARAREATRADAGAALGRRAGAVPGDAAAAHLMQVRCVAPVGDVCGEGAVWAAGEGRLYWTDINRFLVHSLTVADGSVRTWLFDEPAVAVALTDRPGVLLVALASRLILFTPATDGREAFGPALPGWPAVRFNDGRPDPAGAAGHRDDGQQRRAGGRGAGGGAGAGQALSLRAGGAVRASCARGWGSPTPSAGARTSRTFYFADTMANELNAHDYDPATGEVGAARPFLVGLRARASGRVGGGRRGVSLELPLRRGVRGAGGAGRGGRAGGGDALRERHHLHLRRRGAADALHHHGGGGPGAAGGWRGASSRWRRRCRGCRSGCSGWGSHLCSVRLVREGDPGGRRVGAGTPATPCDATGAVRERRWSA